MKKFYSILLAAVSLLCSTNLFAVDVATRADLQAAIDATPAGGTVDIRLTANITLENADMPIRVYANYADAGKTVNLDLNGHNIIAGAGRAIELFKGTLNITGTGTIEKTNFAHGNLNKTNALNTSTASLKAYAGNTSIKDAILVAGSYNPIDANWSNLTIGKDVTINAHAPQAYDKDGNLDENANAISVLDIAAISQFTYSYTAGLTLPTNHTEFMAYFNNADNKSYGYSGSFAWAPYYIYKNANNEQVQVMDYTTGWYTTYGTTKQGTQNNRDYYKSRGGYQGYAYGVNIEVLGKVYGSKYGIKINGNLKSNEGNIPYVHVASTAEVSSAKNTGNAIAIYSSGYGKFLIEGTVHGATGVYVKSGNVELQDAVVYSEYETAYTEPAGQKSGVQAGGSAIVVESNASYAGGQAVTIKGDTKVEGSTGYAIEEAITTADESQVSTIKVEGGTIVAGTQGTAVVTQQTKVNNVVTIVGGNLDEDGFFVKNENGELTDSSAEDFIPEDGNFITTTITDENGKKITVVTESTVTLATANSVAGAAADAAIVWNNTETTSEDITDNKTLAYLEINNTYAQTLTVKEGATLTVGRVVLGVNAQIIVEAGSRLIVTGEQGIVAPVTSNIVLRTSESNPAEFLFNPEVRSNRHPNATVGLIANSYTNSSSDYRYQRFGIPTHTTITGITAKNADSGEDVGLFVRKYENNGWTTVGYLNVAGRSLDMGKMNDPFGYYILQCNTPSVGTLVSFSGELVGNNNATLYTGVNTNGWSTFANSYSAKLDMEAMLAMFNGLPAETNTAVYFQSNVEGTDNTFTWDVLDNTTKYFFDNVKLNPMQTFLIKDPSAEVTTNLELNYEDMVWTPATTTSPAPRRAPQDLTMAAVRILNSNDAVYMIQGGEYSSAIESGYDSEKYLAGAANIYVMNENKYASCATDNLENTYLGFACQEAGNYTIRFENIRGEQFAIRDLVNGQVINMTEDATYEFYAAESNDYRFQIVRRANMPTDVETVENAAVNGNGVYSITGQYMGNMSIWNTLPAGVYVVDGVKRIK